MIALGTGCPVTVVRCPYGHVTIWKWVTPHHMCKHMAIRCQAPVYHIGEEERLAVEAAYAVGGIPAVAAMYPQAALADGTSWMSKWTEGDLP